MSVGPRDELDRNETARNRGRGICGLSRRRWAPLIAVSLGLTALFLVVPVRSQEPIFAGARGSLSDIQYGWPLEWISQDQRSMDPPAGNSQSLCPMRQCPTTILWRGLVGNVAVSVSAQALAVLLVVGGIGARRRRSNSSTT